MFILRNIFTTSSLSDLVRLLGVESLTLDCDQLIFIQLTKFTRGRSISNINLTQSKMALQRMTEQAQVEKLLLNVVHGSYKALTDSILSYLVETDTFMQRHGFKNK